MVTTISQLRGVSRAVAADLDALGLSTTSDLLRMNPAGLMHRRPALKGPKVMRWVLYANLLEIDGMTLDVAHSLVDGGISGLDELHTARRFRDCRSSSRPCRSTTSSSGCTTPSASR